MFLIISSSLYASIYTKETKDLLEYKLDLKYNIKNPMVDIKAFTSKDVNKTKNSTKNQHAKSSGKNKDKEKVLNSSIKNKQKKKRKIFHLLSIFNNKAFIKVQLDNNITSKWYKKNDTISSYKVENISNSYVILKDKNISKMLVINKNKNKNLKVIK